MKSHLITSILFLATFLFGCGTPQISKEETARFSSIKSFLDTRVKQYLRGMVFSDREYGYSASAERFGVFESDLQKYCSVNNGLLNYSPLTIRDADTMMKEGFNAHNNYITEKYKSGVLALASSNTIGRERAQLQSDFMSLSAPRYRNTLDSMLRQHAIGRFTCIANGNSLWTVTAVSYGAFMDGGGGALASPSIWTYIKIEQSVQ